MENILNIAQIVLAVMLVTFILLQARGTGLGSAFGGEGNVYMTKRGIEKTLYKASIAVSILFFAVALANVII